jgi:hypothetical protein
MSHFPYSCSKVENGKTRIYLLTAKGSSLEGTPFVIRDVYGKVNQQEKILLNQK